MTKNHAKKITDKITRDLISKNYTNGGNPDFNKYPYMYKPFKEKKTRW